MYTIAAQLAQERERERERERDQTDCHINRTISRNIISHNIPDATMILRSALGETTATTSEEVPMLASETGMRFKFCALK